MPYLFQEILHPGESDLSPHAPHAGEVNIRLLRRNLRTRKPFSPHADKTRSLPLMRADGGVRRGKRAGSADACEATGPDSAAPARPCRQLRADATRAASRHRLA
jgi:hypothetical protein